MKWCLVILAVFFSFCDSRNAMPDDIIPMEKMDKILWDMLLADRFSSQFLVKDSAKINVKEETFKLYGQVFAIHHITKEQFSKSIKYYMNHPYQNRVIFDSLASRATRSKNETYNQIK